MSELSKLETVLKAKSYSVTSQRKLVFSVLENNDALAMKDIVTKLKGKVDRASVYRSIDLFVELGIVNQVYIGWKYKLELSDEFSDHHHHIVCIKCQKIEVIKEHKQLEDKITAIAEDLDYKLSRHTIELAGLCRKCR